jgi:hypothetical protein
MNIERINVRQNTIRGYLKESKRLFQTSEDFSLACYLERQAQVLENMTDEEFKKQYPLEVV